MIPCKCSNCLQHFANTDAQFSDNVMQNDTGFYKVGCVPGRPLAYLVYQRSVEYCNR